MYSPTDRPWCGVQHGRRKCARCLRTSWRNTYRSMSDLYRFMLTTTSCRSLTFAMKKRNHISKFHFSVSVSRDRQLSQFSVDIVCRWLTVVCFSYVFLPCLPACLPVWRQELTVWNVIISVWTLIGVQCKLSLLTDTVCQSCALCYQFSGVVMTVVCTSSSIRAHCSWMGTACCHVQCNGCLQGCISAVTMTVILSREHCYGSTLAGLLDALPLSWPTVSKHLRQQHQSSSSSVAVVFNNTWIWWA